MVICHDTAWPEISKWRLQNYDNITRYNRKRLVEYALESLSISLETSERGPLPELSHSHSLPVTVDETRMCTLCGLIKTRSNGDDHEWMMVEKPHPLD